jgi:hypothetical protein
VRLNWSLVLGLALVWAGAACGPDEGEAPAADGTDEVEMVPDGAPPPTTADGEKSSAPGVVRGVVRSRQTDDPVEGVLVSAGDLGASTDASGTYALPLLPPGSLTVHAYRRGFRPESTRAVVNSGEMTMVDLSLAPAAPPCCELEGDWSARLVLDSAGLNSRPSARALEGRLTFAAYDGEGNAAEPAVRVGRTSGAADLDVGPLLGSDVGAVGELEGMVFSDDSVAITLFPRFGDWAIELRGLQSADSILGKWFQRASCCGAYGRFVLARDESRGGGRGSR